MKVKDNNYPYPMLINGLDDYIDSSFDVDIIDGPKDENGIVHLELEYNLNSAGLNKLINEKRAKIVIQVSCRSTSFRRTYSFINKSLLIEIDKTLLGGKVEFAPFVVSTEELTNYQFDEHNKTYFKTPSTIRRGDKLAVADIINFELQFYDAFRPIASIVSIQRNPGKNPEEIEIDLSKEKITIYLDESLMNEYNSLREITDLRLFLSTNIVMPAIIEALAEMKHNYDQDLELRWQRNIKKILKSMDIDLFTTDLSLYGITNKIFKNGLYTSLKSIESFFNIREDDQSET